MLEFAEQLTLDPANITQMHHEGLRSHGWTDENIIDIVHMVALYAYAARLAEGLGAELEPGRGWESLVEKLPFRDQDTHKTFSRLIGAVPQLCPVCGRNSCQHRPT